LQRREATTEAWNVVSRESTHRGHQCRESTFSDASKLCGNFDDLFEIPLELVTGRENQAIAVDVVEPGVAPVRLTGQDTVLIEKVFQDATPWIVVSLLETPVRP
jgi:hypothetical protein